MNILPFVTIFLIILAIFSFSSFKDYKIAATKKNIITGYIAAERSARNMIADKAYQKAPKKKLEKIGEKKEEKKTDDESEDLFNRDDPARLKKINLHLIFKEEKHPIFEDMISKLLKRYYSHASFYQKYSEKNLSEDLTKAIIAKGKKLLKDNENHSLTFLDLYPEDPSLRFIFYKMLKGTEDYNLVMQKGYPPFSDFFSLDASDKKPIFFAGLNHVMLDAIFGEKVKQEILRQEALLRLSDKKRLTLDETSFKNILHKSLFESTKVDKMVEYFDFSKIGLNKLDLVCFEEKTHIKATKPAL